MTKEPKKKGRKTSYDSYKREYEKAEAKMKKKGFTMKSEMLTKAQWEYSHTALTEDRLDEIRTGQRKLVGNINRDLVATQQWEYSVAQARALQQVNLKVNNTKMKLEDIRAGKIGYEDFGSLISQRKKELEEEGLSKAVIRKKISREFWNSPD